MNSAAKMDGRVALLFGSFRFRFTVLAMVAATILWWLMSRQAQVGTINILLITLLLFAPALVIGAVWGWLTFNRGLWLRVTRNLAIATAILLAILFAALASESSITKLFQDIVSIELPRKPPASWVVKDH